MLKNVIKENLLTIYISYAHPCNAPLGARATISAYAPVEG